MVLYFGFFLTFLLSKHIFILFSVWFFWSLLPLLQLPWNCQGQELVLTPFSCWFFSFASFLARIGLAACYKLIVK